MFKLRDYQVKAIEDCKKVLLSKKKDKGIAVLPTAAGKSIIVAELAKAVDYPLIVLQPSKELLKQNYSKFIQIGGEASIYSVSTKQFQRKNVAYTVVDGKEVPCEEIGKVTYATIGSIMKDISKFKKLGVKGLIIDEVHINSKGDGNAVRRFIKGCNIKNIIGLTATPIYLENSFEGATLKMMNRTVPRMFTKIIHVTQISELVKNKYWSPLIYRSIQEDGSILKPNSSGSDFTDKSQAEYYDINNLDKTVKWIVDKLEEQDIRKSILIFVPSIKQAEELKTKIPKSEVVHSKIDHKERDRIVEGFKNLEIKVVINVNVLSVGFDHPQLDTIITTRPTMSMALYYQQIGRGVRIHPKKESCAIIDLSGNYDRFGRIENINFEEIEGYGWGMFNGDTLLTDFPIASISRPTKQSLRLKRGNSGSVVIYFGKYTNKTVKQVHDKDPQYLMWMIDKVDFRGKKGNLLREDIKNILKL